MPGIWPPRDPAPRPTRGDLAMDLIACLVIAGVLLAALVLP